MIYLLHLRIMRRHVLLKSFGDIQKYIWHVYSYAFLLCYTWEKYDRTLVWGFLRSWKYVSERYKLKVFYRREITPYKVCEIFKIPLVYCRYKNLFQTPSLKSNIFIVIVVISVNALALSLLLYRSSRDTLNFLIVDHPL